MSAGSTIMTIEDKRIGHALFTSASASFASSLKEDRDNHRSFPSSQESRENLGRAETRVWGTTGCIMEPI